jgi:diadenosine tetraphosphate (Ap4A) HIT family hydrolase
MTIPIHPQLAKDCLPINNLGVCRVYLQNNSNFPWLILVPMRPDIKEIFDLEQVDYEQMMSEVRAVTKHFAGFTGADKMNVATLGNVVPQLHIHIIARFENDAAWPNPVWNVSLPPAPYAPEKAELLIKELRAIF